MFIKYHQFKACKSNFIFKYVINKLMAETVKRLTTAFKNFIEIQIILIKSTFKRFVFYFYFKNKDNSNFNLIDYNSVLAAGLAQKFAFFIIIFSITFMK